MIGKWTAVVLAAALALPGTEGVAATIEVNVGGIESWDGAGDPDNVTILRDLGAGASVTGLGWSVGITPFGMSYYSEATVWVSDSTGEGGFWFTAGSSDAIAGEGIQRSYASPIVTLASAGLPNVVLPDGILRLEFFDSYDDVADAVDAMWSGTLTVEYDAATPVPLPAGGVLLLSGLAAIAAVRTRRAG